jgi:Inositol polyphosphate kinase
MVRSPIQLRQQCMPARLFHASPCCKSSAAASAVSRRRNRPKNDSKKQQPLSFRAQEEEKWRKYEDYKKKRSTVEKELEQIKHKRAKRYGYLAAACCLVVTLSFTYYRGARRRREMEARGELPVTGLNSSSRSSSSTEESISAEVSEESPQAELRIIQAAPQMPQATLQIDSDELDVFEHQVGGHGIGIRDEGLLRFGSSSVLKPLQSGRRGSIERNFYVLVSNGDDEQLKSFLPQFQGVVNIIDSTGRTREYVQLEDATSGFVRPCIIDLKMGTVSWDPDALPSKAARERRKNPLQSQLGFRVVGMKVFDHNAGEYHVLDKRYGRDLTLDTADAAFRRFASTGQPLHPDIHSCVLKQLHHIEQWFHNVHKFNFYASSLLIIFEGDPARNQAIQRGEMPPARVHMIDFGHVFYRADCGTHDDGYEEGLANVRKFWEGLTC